MRTALAFTLLVSAAAMADDRDPESVRRWREDLQVFRTELPRRHHRDFAFHLPAATFHGLIDRLAADVPELQDHEIKVRLAGIVARLGDRHGHTLVVLSNASAGFHVLPLNFYSYSDGLFIRAAAKEYGEAAGARVLAIGDTPAAEALDRVLTIAAGDNDMSRLAYAQELIGMPEVLRALKIVKEGDPGAPVPLRVRKPDGTEVTIAVAARDSVDQVEWVDVRSPAPATPLSRRHPPRSPYAEYIPSMNFWFEYLPDERLLYVNYSAVQDTKEKSVAGFFREVFAFADAHDVQKFVLDVRLNGGGNNMLNRPIVQGLAARTDTIAKRGSLFVLIGRTTFSAAQNLVNVLARESEAIFVGEPTGGAPNHYGDSTRFTLPHSRLTVRASTLWWQDAHPQDPRPWIPPHVAVELRSTDDREGRDPALEAVRRYQPAPPLAPRLREALAAGGKEAAAEVYRAWRADRGTRYLSAEEEINSAAVALFAGDAAQAVAMFELNAELHPRSWRAWERLGRAYVAVEKRDAAIAAFEKALAADPSAVVVLERLERLKK